MSYIYFTIGMTVTSGDNEVHIKDRAAVIALRQSPHGVSSRNYKNRSELTTLLEALEKKSSFQIEWQPEEKYQLTFNNLKKKKIKVKITFYFFERENSATGKVLWSTTATANGVTILNATGNGKQRETVQNVDIKSDSFKENK